MFLTSCCYQERDLAQGGLLNHLAQRTNESVRRGREEARRSIARCQLSIAHAAALPEPAGSHTGYASSSAGSQPAADAASPQSTPGSRLHYPSIPSGNGGFARAWSEVTSYSSDASGGGGEGGRQLPYGGYAGLGQGRSGVPPLRLSAANLKPLGGRGEPASLDRGEEYAESSDDEAHNHREGFFARTTQRGLKKLQRQAGIGFMVSSSAPVSTPESAASGVVSMYMRCDRASRPNPTPGNS